MTVTILLENGLLWRLVWIGPFSAHQPVGEQGWFKNKKAKDYVVSGARGRRVPAKR
jgi:hypothetical protein